MIDQHRSCRSRHAPPASSSWTRSISFGHFRRSEPVYNTFERVFGKLLCHIANERIGGFGFSPFSFSYYFCSFRRNSNLRQLPGEPIICRLGSFVQRRLRPRSPRNRRGLSNARIVRCNQRRFNSLVFCAHVIVRKVCDKLLHKSSPCRMREGWPSRIVDSSSPSKPSTCLPVFLTGPTWTAFVADAGDLRRRLPDLLVEIQRLVRAAGEHPLHGALR